MATQALISLAGTIAVLLLIGAGFCMIVQATPLASRLFVWALVVIFAPVLLLAILGGFRGWLATNPWRTGGLAFVAGILLIGPFAWFAFRWKLIRTLQGWLTPRIGREADGNVTGSYVRDLLESIFGFLKFSAIAALVLLLLYAAR